MALLATQIQRPPEMEMRTEYPFRERDLHSRRLPADHLENAEIDCFLLVGRLPKVFRQNGRPMPNQTKLI